MNKILAIALNTFREAIRNQLLYSIVLLAVVLVGVSAFFGSVSIGQQEAVIKDFGLFSLSLFGVAVTILSGISLLKKEIKDKTVYQILSKPVARWQFILGKHLGLCLTTAVLVSLMGLLLTGFVAAFEGTVDFLLFQAILFVTLELIVVAALAIFFSSIVITTTLIGIFTFATYVSGRSIAYLKVFLVEHKIEDPSVHLMTKVFDYLLPDLSLFNISDQIVYQGGVNAEHLLLAVTYCVCYSAACIFLASLIFSQRELS